MSNHPPQISDKPRMIVHIFIVATVGCRKQATVGGNVLQWTAKRPNMFFND